MELWKQKLLNAKQHIVAGALTAGAALPALADPGAATFDASSYATSITGLIAGMLAIGGAVFALTLSIKSTKWARRAL